MRGSLEKLLASILSRLTSTTLLLVSSGLSTTTYTLSGNISDYRLLIVTAFSAYSNNWTTVIDAEEFPLSTNGHYLSLGTEYSIYNLAIAYVSDTSIRIISKGSGTVGVRITGVR